MAAFPDKVSVQTELSEKRSNFNLSCMHLTTGDFMQFCPAYVRDNIPKESWKLKSDVFARLSPLYTPLLGKAKLVQRAYFVPFRVLTPQWNDFITKVPHVGSGSTQYNVVETPYFTIRDLYTFLTSNDCAYVTTGTADIVGSGNNYSFKPFGRYVLKVLHGLGYKIPNVPNSSDKISAMRLLALAKVYYDWCTDGHYIGTYLDYTDVAALFNIDSSSVLSLSATQLLSIFRMMYHVNYEPDYFVSSFDTPVHPAVPGQMSGGITLPDITNNANNGANSMLITTIPINVSTPTSSTMKPTNGTPFIGSSASVGGTVNYAAGVLTQYAIHALKLANDYCMRFNMVGAKSIDRYLARFGSLLTAEKLRRSVFLGKHETPLQFGAIYSTNNGTGNTVGDYAGSGIINSDGTQRFDVEFQSDEFGCYLVVYYILPHIMYMQGLDRNVLHLTVEDYFNGQFDSLGYQAIAAGELYTSMDDTDTHSNLYKNVFAYSPQKAEYKKSYDFVSGDFSVPSLVQLNKYWHLARVFDPGYWTSQGLNYVSKTPQFINGLDAAQYDRIFQYSSEKDNFDHFNIVFQFAVDVNAPALPLYQTYEFDGEGKNVSIKVDGTQP